LGVPNAVALVLVLGGLLGVGALFGGLLSSSINEFTQLLPSYRVRFGSVVAEAVDHLSRLGIDFGASTEEANPFDPQAAVGFAGNLVGSLGKFVNDAFLIFLVVLFLLLEATSIPRKVEAAFGESPELEGQVGEVVTAVRRYLVIKTIANGFTGLFVYAGLIALDVKFAPLWALIAFLLGFIPAIGATLAAIPAIALALVDNGTESAVAVTVLYLAVDMTIGNFIVPQVLGPGVGLSPLVVVVSLVFWGFVLGPVGMVLAVPLTVILRIMLDAQPQTRWLAVLLGPAMPSRQGEAIAEQEDVGAPRAA
jgi:predicted PurR-regulated permease PerM